MKQILARKWYHSSPSALIVDRLICPRSINMQYDSPIHILIRRARLARNSWHPHFQRHHSSSSNRSPQHHHREYLINVGKATLTLQHELPLFFQIGLHSTQIYAEDVLFLAPSNIGFTAQGLAQYKVAASMLKWSTTSYFVDIEYTILGMSQVNPMREPEFEEEGRPSIQPPSPLGLGDEATAKDGEQERSHRKLFVRWIFEATPRHLVLASNLFNHTSSLDPSSGLRRSVYEGVFLYEFDNEGKIHRHSLVSIHPTPPIFRWVGSGSGAPVTYSN